MINIQNNHLCWFFDIFSQGNSHLTGEEEGFDPMGFSLAIDIRWLREVGKHLVKPHRNATGKNC